MLPLHYRDNHGHVREFSRAVFLYSVGWESLQLLTRVFRPKDEVNDSQGKPT